MDINVRFWNSAKCITETRYFNSEFLGGANSEAILKAFQTATVKLDASKCELKVFATPSRETTVYGARSLD